MGEKSVLHRFAAACRRVCVGVLAPAWPGVTHSELEQRIAALSRSKQCAIVIAVLSFIVACAGFAAQFGVLGLIVFAAVVVFIVG
ncbi:MAG: hypothetical protein AAF744_08740 [Pseudomonadota bacterium]